MNTESTRNRIYQAAYAAAYLLERHAETLQTIGTPGQNELGAALSVEDGVIKFKWLEIEVTSRMRFVVHASESLVLEYPFTHIKGDKETHVVSLFKDASGIWYLDSACTQRLRGGLRQGSEGTEIIAAAMLDSSLVQPLGGKPAG